MISTGNKRFTVFSFVYRGLILCVVILGIILIGGTIYGVFFHKAPPTPRQIDTAIENAGEGQPFTGIGRIRVSTADPQPGIVILFITFLYDPNDKAFSEELALRVKDFREIIGSYIGSFSSAELQKRGEEVIKAELLRRFNAILRLGQIKTLYFSDFMIVG